MPGKCICPLDKVLTYKILIYLLNFPMKHIHHVYFTGVSNWLQLKCRYLDQLWPNGNPVPFFSRSHILNWGWLLMKKTAFQRAAKVFSSNMVQE